jgi:hypothetical protein
VLAEVDTGKIVRSSGGHASNTPVLSPDGGRRVQSLHRRREFHRRGRGPEVRRVSARARGGRRNEDGGLDGGNHPTSSDANERQDAGSTGGWERPGPGSDRRRPHRPAGALDGARGVTHLPIAIISTTQLNRGWMNDQRLTVIDVRR